jgi:hypothetical protein
MFREILSHTPVWVWGILLALVAFGIRQTSERRIGALTLAIMTTALISWSGLSLFASYDWRGGVIAVYLAVAATVAELMRRSTIPSGARYELETGQLTIPGSILPLFLMVGIFLCRFGIAVFLATHPQAKSSIMFTVPSSALCGLIAGLFAGRNLRLMRLVRRPSVLFQGD